MAKILLINSNRLKHPWPVIPFGLCYIATILEANGSHNVCFLDLCFSLDCNEDIQKAVRNFVPDVIGISIRNIDDTGGYNILAMPTKLELEQMKGMALYMGKMMLSGRMDEVFKIISSNYKHLGEVILYENVSLQMEIA